MTRRIFALVGPTATGKTTLAVRVAPELGAEIVACDSMTIYSGMDVGTAKPTTEERARVRHHLLDVADPRDRFTVARFQRVARDAITDIEARGCAPLLVGGSGLHFRAVVDGLSFPPEDPGVRARLDREPLPALAARLGALDPEASRFVDLRNKRRVVRALEVIEVAGRPFSSFRAEWERRNPVRAAGLRLPIEVAASRIEARVRAQVDAGLFDEVRALVANGFRHTVTASQAVPYREALRYLDGELDLEGFVREASKANRRLARRQLAWFERDPRIRWFDATDPERALEDLRAYYGERAEEGAR